MITELKERMQTIQVLDSHIIVVCAYNEEWNLRILLPQLDPKSTLVVDDGSTDKSSSIAERLGFKVLRHPRRMGKTSALADGIAYAKDHGIGVVVDMGADAMPWPGAVDKLLDAVRPADVGGASARQIPMKSGTRAAYRIDEVIWATLASAKEYQSRLGLDSYLGAVMFAFKVGNLELSEVTNDDELVGYYLKTKGLKTVFVKDAVVQFDASVSLRHILERRQRMLYGHIVQPESGAPSRSRTISLFGLVWAVKEKPSRIPWVVPAIIIEGLARALAWSDFRAGRHAKYERWVSVSKVGAVDSGRVAGS